MSSNTFNNEDNSNNNSNIEDDNKYYDENCSLNASYEMDTLTNTRLRENEFTNQEISNNANTRILFNNDNTVTMNNINSNTNIILHRESSLNEFSNFNVYSEFTGNNLENNSDSEYLNRNFDSNLDEIFDNLTYLITTEKNNIKNDKLNIQTAKRKFIDYKNLEILKLEKDKEQWKDNIKIIETLQCKESDILDLDLGGTNKITTSRSTLTKFPNSALAAMFSGRHEIPKHNGRLFIDRDGLSFKNMINFLRSGKFPIFKDKTEEMKFFEELEFWQIPVYEGKENSIKNSLQFDPEWCASTLVVEHNNTLIKKHNMQHGIVFCKTPMDVHSPFIEFKIVMNIPCRGKSHLFIGLVDKTKYKYENLVSTFWKDSPSSFYWDVWNTKLIKTDENGIQVGSVSGYGCQCEEYETSLSIKYDHKSRTVSYHKNGISQGIAFRNVPSGLYPSLDIWFESGTVEIMKNTSAQEKIFL